MDRLTTVPPHILSSVCVCRMEGLSWTIPAPWLFTRAVYCGPTSPSSACYPLAPVAMTTLKGCPARPLAWGPKSAALSAAPQTPKGSTPCWTTCWLRTCTSVSTPCWAPWCPWMRAAHGPWTSFRGTPRSTWRGTGPSWRGCAWCWRRSARPLKGPRTGWVKEPGRWSRDGCEEISSWLPWFFPPLVFTKTTHKRQMLSHLYWTGRQGVPLEVGLHSVSINPR